MLLFFHNPDYYNTATLERYWTNIQGGSPVFPAVRADGYLGRPALTSTSGYVWLNQVLEWPLVQPDGNREFRIGGRFRFDSAPPEPQMIMAALDFNQNWQCALVLNADMTLSIYRGLYAEELRSSEIVLNTSQTYRIGFKGRIHGTAGTAEAWLNQTAVVRFVSGNTAAFADVQNFSGAAFGLIEDCAVNHVYYGDSSGYQNDLIPGLLVQPLYPISTRAVNTWLPESLHALIDDTVPDDDTTYAFGTESNAILAVGVGPLGATAQIHAVQTTALLKNEAGDIAQWAAHQLMVEQDGVVYLKAQLMPFEGSHIYEIPSSTFPYRVIRRMDYNTPRQLGENWTPALVNAAGFGGRLVL